MSESDHRRLTERALAFVAEFQGDPRCGLNCVHAEALAAEVYRLRRKVERLELRAAASSGDGTPQAETTK